MGCGCGGGRPIRNVAGARPVVTPAQRSIQGGLAAAKSPTELRALAVQQQKSPAGMNKERLAIEKKRRETILKKFGK